MNISGRDEKEPVSGGCCCVDSVFELDLSDLKGSSKMQTECS